MSWQLVFVVNCMICVDDKYPPQKTPKTLIFVQLLKQRKQTSLLERYAGNFVLG